MASPEKNTKSIKELTFENRIVKNNAKFIEWFEGNKNESNDSYRSPYFSKLKDLENSIGPLTNYDKNDISYERIPLNKNYDKVVKEDLKHDFDLDGSKK